MPAPYPFPITTAEVNAAQAQEIVPALLARSTWFEVLPLPDDVYRVTFRRDEAGVRELVVEVLTR